MAPMLHVKWGGEFWCCACLWDHRPGLMLQQQCRQIWAGWLWAQSGFSVLFSPLHHIYTNPLSCSIAALTTKGKHSSVFSSNCLHFAGCLCWIFFFCCSAVWLWEHDKLWSALTRLILNAWKYLKYIYQNYRQQWATLAPKLSPAQPITMMEGWLFSLCMEILIILVSLLFICVF